MDFFIDPHTTYYFSSWIASIYPTSPAELAFSINGNQIVFDTTPVPLSPTALLLGTGLIGLAGLGWRHRKRKN